MSTLVNGSPTASSASESAPEKPGFRTKTIATRTTPEELREVEAAAEKSGKTLAVWLRELALKAARERPADPTELLLDHRALRREDGPWAEAGAAASGGCDKGNGAEASSCTEFQGLVRGLAWGVFSSLNMVADSLELLPEWHGRENTFATAEWYTERKRWVFLTSSAAYREKVLPLYSAWLDLFILCVMGCCDIPNVKPFWFVLDELASLNKLPQLHTAVTENKGMGVQLYSHIADARSRFPALRGSSAEYLLNDPLKAGIVAKLVPLVFRRQ